MLQDKPEAPKSKLHKVNTIFLMGVLPYVASLWLGAAAKHFISLPPWTHKSMVATSIFGMLYAVMSLYYIMEPPKPEGCKLFTTGQLVYAIISLVMIIFWWSVIING